MIDPERSPVVVDWEGRLRLAARRPLRYSLHWLREVALGRIEGDLGLIVDAGEAAIELAVAGAFRRRSSTDERGWMRLAVFKRSAAQLSVSVQSVPPVPAQPDGLAIAGMEEKTASALEKKCGADLSCRYKSASEETVLVDCSFSSTEEGQGAYRRALDGDYTWMPEGHVEIHWGALTCDMRQDATLELHLPFLDRKEWAARLELLEKMEVSCEADGRLQVIHGVEGKNSSQSVLALASGLPVGRVHSASSFTLTFCDQRRVPCAQALTPVLEGYGFDTKAVADLAGELDIELTLSIPGALGSAWLGTPGERQAAFFPVYARLSVALQRALRTWVPYIYFTDFSRYEDLEAAYPLVVYQASRPCPGAPKFDFTYDVLSPPSMATFFRVAGWQLPKVLARIEQVLLATGNEGTAQLYSPMLSKKILASVQRRPKLLHSLVAGDALFMNALVNFGCQSRQLRADAGKGLARCADDFVKACHGKLRRLYDGKEFLALGALLLVEATSALNADGPGIAAVVRISQGQPGGVGLTLVNDAYR